MDSFYEQPRTAPVPASTSKIPAAPEVPEISMLFQSNPTSNSDTSDSIYSSYNAWKARKQSENPTKINYCVNPPPQSDHMNSQYLSKQVRFQSPVALHNQQTFAPRTQNPTAPSATKPNYQHPMRTNVEENLFKTSIPEKSNLFSKPFEQIYMANIPNRQLDLSIIEPIRPTPKRRENLENISPNINLGMNSVRHKHSVGYNTNAYLKDVSEYAKFKNDNVNKTKKFNDYQYPEKLGMRSVENTYEKGINYDTETKSESNKYDPLEKNRVIDLFNYRRGGIEAVGTAYSHRQTLDNLEFSNHKQPEKPIDTQIRKVRSNNCLYDSFNSHNCENGKHTCSCNTNKELLTNPSNNPTSQTNLDVCKNVDVNVVNKNSDEPTVKDLLKIIHQQNDQLLVLQKQVAALLNNRDTPKQIEALPAPPQSLNVFGDKCRTSTQLETPQQGLCNPLQKCLPRKGPLPQFSLDVMTSFEVSIRRQQNLNRAYKDAINHQPKICEVTETESDVSDQSPNTNAGNMLYGISNKPKIANDSDVSLTLNEPVHVRETCPTPNNTVRIDMDDYSSDSDVENSADDQWFYKNVQGQVKNILCKSGIWNGAESDVSDPCNDLISKNIRKKVQEATIKHLKSIGVHVPSVDNSDDVMQAETSNNIGYNPQEVSFAVKQLLMKYLPTEQLAKLAYIQTQKNTVPQQADQIGFIKRRPEFSFATVQYMQKYNLLNDGRKSNPVIRQEENFDRILDVTAIKQQPKLL